MTGKTHQLIGILVGVGGYLLIVPPHYAAATLGTALVFSSVGALLPDIDQPASRIWQSLPFGRVAGEIVNPFLKHRNLSHSLLGIFLVGWVMRTLLQQVPSYWGWENQHLLIVFLAAYASHLVADMVTVEGIPLFFPWHRMFGFPPWPFQGLRIETGKWFENLVIFPVVNLGLLLLLGSHLAAIRAFLLR